jgi:nucleotide-binding universal stress UspA family protein
MSLIVVGVDGSTGSATALGWAAGVAAQWDADLEVVLAWEVIAPYLAPHPPMAVAEEEAEAQAQLTVEAMVAELPEGTVAETRTLEGAAASMLVEAGRGADLLVVGAHGAHGAHGGGIASGIGSTATRCAVRSEVPTAVIPTEGEAAPGGPVVVGVDGSATGARALRVALRLADADDDIVAVNAWTVPAVTGPAVTAFDVSLFEEAGQWALDDTLGALAPEDRARVTTRIRQGGPRPVLREEAESARLVVVGTEGHSTLLHRLLGSTVTYLLHHHPTPIVVVPAETDRERAD